MAAPRSLIPLLFLMVPYQTASVTINICHWSGERGIGTVFIVNADYPGPIPQQSHRCQCTLQRPPNSTANRTAVSLLVKEAYFTGSSCQQKLYVEFPGNSTQSSTVCSSNQTVINRIIFSNAEIESEVLTLTFDKMLNISDAGTFMIEVNVVGKVAFQCSPLSNLTAPTNSAPTAATTNEYETAKLGLIAGVAVGGVLLLGIIIVVVLITRFRRKRRSHNKVNSPQDSSSSFKKNGTGQVNKGQDNKVEMQMYAVTPEQNTNVANHSKEKKLKDESPNVASKVDETTPSVQRADDLNLPTETYAVVDQDKKRKTRAEANPSPYEDINMDYRKDSGKAITPAPAASAEDPLYDEAVECRVRPRAETGVKDNQDNEVEVTIPTSTKEGVTQSYFSESTYDTVIIENELYDK